MEKLNFRETEKTSQFESRKKDHIELALRDENEALGGSALDRVQLIHEALPDINFKDIKLHTQALNQILPTPFLVSSMTAGHGGSVSINRTLAQVCSERGWLMGVGSQRRELSDPNALKEWENIRVQSPNVQLLGNIGIAQLIQTSTDQILKLSEALNARAMIIHLNALQEVMQPEGTTDFAGGLKAIERIAGSLGLPVIVKETGCGISPDTARRLFDVGVTAIDISGFGGTHWGRIEGGRSSEAMAQVSQTYANWGIPTAVAMKSMVDAGLHRNTWASGGLRSGLDAAKMIAMGAQVVGFAKPILAAALQGPEALNEKMQTLEYELKVALFCTGCSELVTFREKKLWRWQS